MLKCDFYGTKELYTLKLQRTLLNLRLESRRRRRAVINARAQAHMIEMKGFHEAENKRVSAR
jgi:hypothetical protein